MIPWEICQKLSNNFLITIKVSSKYAEILGNSRSLIIKHLETLHKWIWIFSLSQFLPGQKKTMLHGHQTLKSKFSLCKNNSWTQPHEKNPAFNTWINFDPLLILFFCTFSLHTLVVKTFLASHLTFFTFYINKLHKNAFINFILTYLALTYFAYIFFNIYTLKMNTF